MAEKAHKDWALVVALGGPKTVADLLGYTGDGRVQRVQNWKWRGVPSLVKLDRPDLFPPGVRSVGVDVQASGLVVGA